MAFSGMTSTTSLLLLRAASSSDMVLCISSMASASVSSLKLKLSRRWRSLMLTLGLVLVVLVVLVVILEDALASTATKLLRTLERGLSELSLLLLPDTERPRESGVDGALFSNIARRFLTPALLCLASAIVVQD